MKMMKSKCGINRGQLKVSSVFCLFFICFIACSPAKENSKSDSAVNTGAEVEVIHADGLQIRETPKFYLVDVFNPKDSTEQIGSYVISKSPGTFGQDTISGPVQSFGLSSTTFSAFFDRLGLISAIKGMTYTDRVLNQTIKKRISDGQILELTSAGELDFEKVISVKPEAFMVYSFGDSDYSRLQEQGIHIVHNLEYLESTPLGRAEWIKLVGCLTGQLDEATAVFQALEKRYMDVKLKAMLSSHLPTIFTGSNYKGLWYAPGNDSYIAHYIRDAGAMYSFHKYEGQGSIEIEYEAALETITTADYWGMVVSQEGEYTIEDFEEAHQNAELFKSFQNGNVFVCNAATSDYFGDAVMEPDVVLADLVKIIRPNYLPDHQPKYFFDLMPN